MHILISIVGINNISHSWQIMFKSSQLPQSIRNLTAEHVNKLIKVPGIVIACSNSRSRATKIQLRCKGNCGKNATLSKYIYLSIYLSMFNISIYLISI
jgi:DNA replicative helicase MCM subunit Mcm2 (Cdc46/Mcm family)